MRHDNDLLAAIIVQVLVRGHEIAVHDAADTCHLLQRRPLPLCSGREFDDVIHGEGSLGGNLADAVVAFISDVQVSRNVHRYSGRPSQAGAAGEASVPGKAVTVTPYHCRNRATRSDFADIALEEHTS